MKNTVDVEFDPFSDEYFGQAQTGGPAGRPQVHGYRGPEVGAA